MDTSVDVAPVPQAEQSTQSKPKKDKKKDKTEVASPVVEAEATPAASTTKVSSKNKAKKLKTAEADN